MAIILGPDKSFGCLSCFSGEFDSICGKIGTEFCPIFIELQILFHQIIKKEAKNEVD